MVSPKVLEPVWRHFGVPDRVLNVLVPEVVLQGPCVVAIVGELEPAGMRSAGHPRAARHDGQSAMRGLTGGDGSDVLDAK